MVYFDRSRAREEALNYLQYPIPRTPVDIVRHLKEKLDNFYPNTNEYRVVKKLRENILNELVKNNIVIKYTQTDEEWPQARELLRKEYERSNRSKPRKLKSLYQINFLYLGRERIMRNLPKLKDVNLELTAMFYRFTQEKEIENYSLNLLNLFYCYDEEEYKGEIRMKVHGRQFTEKESRLLDRSLKHTDKFNRVFDELPFQPDIEKAVTFLEKL